MRISGQTRVVFGQKLKCLGFWANPCDFRSEIWICRLFGQIWGVFWWNFCQEWNLDEIFAPCARCSHDVFSRFLFARMFTRFVSSHNVCTQAVGQRFCAAKVAERKKTKNNPFFQLKISELCVLNVPTKSAVGWNCIEPEATSLTMQGFMSPPCRFSCPIAVVAIAWNNCANTQRLGVAEKSRRPVRDFLREKFAKKNAFLSAEIWVWKREKKSQTIFSDFWSWSVCRVSFSKSHTSRCFFQLDSSLCWVGYALRMCPQLVNRMCSVKKQQSPPTSSGGACLAGRPSRKQPWKNRKKSHDEVLHRAWRKRFCARFERNLHKPREMHSFRLASPKIFDFFLQRRTLTNLKRTHGNVLVICTDYFVLKPKSVKTEESPTILMILFEKPFGQFELNVSEFSNQKQQRVFQIENFT